MNQTDYQFLIYNTDEENISINTIVKDDTIWVSQKAMAQLFGCTVDNISLHLKNIFDEGELLSSSTTEDFSVVQKEGQRNVRRKVSFYNLDAIISVGYRINSIQATKFRIWATRVLKEYMQNNRRPSSRLLICLKLTLTKLRKGKFYFTVCIATTYFSNLLFYFGARALICAYSSSCSSHISYHIIFTN